MIYNDTCTYMRMELNVFPIKCDAQDMAFTGFSLLIPQF